MNFLFIEYPKCSTCKKAKTWLDEHGISYEDRNIVELNPTEAELTEWFFRSKQPLKKFFNTSGRKYQALDLKNKLAQLSEEEQIALLASDGMLVKRPLLIGQDFILIGFREKEWEAALLK